MKKTRKMVYGFFVILLVFLGMTACVVKEQETPSDIQVSDYTITSKDGQSYLVFEDITPYTIDNSSSDLSGMEMYSVEFSSMAAFRNAVTKGTLTERQKKQVARFEKDETSAILICDINDLYLPVTPSKAAMGAVYWNGRDYGGEVKLGSDSSAMFWCMPKDIFDEIYQREQADLSSNEYVTITETEQLENGRTAVLYSTKTGRFKQIRFTLTEGEKTIYVDKCYCLESETMTSIRGPLSPTVPYTISLYCIESNQYYTYYVSGLTEDPADEWLMEFGIEKFVDTSLETE